jgi:hypothetical protein
MAIAVYYMPDKNPLIGSRIKISYIFIYYIMESETIWKKRRNVKSSLNKNPNKNIRNITDPLEILEIKQKIQMVNDEKKQFSPSPMFDSMNVGSFFSSIKEGQTNMGDENAVTGGVDAEKKSISLSSKNFKVNINADTGISFEGSAIPVYTIQNLVDSITGRDFADDELEDDLKKNDNGFSGTNKASVCMAGKTTEVQLPKTEGFTQSVKEAKREIEEDIKKVDNLRKTLEDTFLYQFIKKNLKLIEFPIIYFRFFIKKIGILFCNILTNVLNVDAVTDDEKRMVISNITSIFNVFISVLITYNWFFLMFYENDGSKIKTFEITTERLKKMSNTLNFMFEFTIYPLILLDKFMLKDIPWFLKWIFKSYDLIFLVMYISVYNITHTWGPSIFDLFYDSFKLLRNHGGLRPWDETLQHTYDKGEKYSITLKTYWFFHILIFGGQLPTLMPSFYQKKEEKHTLTVEEIANQVIPAIPTDPDIRDNFVNQILPKRTGGGENDPVTGKATAIIDKDTDQGADTENSDADQENPGEGPENSGADPKNSGEDEDTNTADHSDKNITEDPAAVPYVMPTTKQTTDTDKSSESEETQNTNTKKKSSFLPSLSSLSPGLGLAAGAATMLASGSWSVFMNFLRFMISQYFVTVTGMLVSLYLIVYSLLGMSCFSGVGLFKTIGLVDTFIQETSLGVTNEIGDECETDNWHYTQKTFSTIFHNVTSFAFKFLYIGLIIIILLFSSNQYYHKISPDKIGGNVSASPTSFFKWGLILTNLITILILVLGYYLYNYKTPLDKNSKNTVNISPIKKQSPLPNKTQESQAQPISSPQEQPETPQEQPETQQEPLNDNSTNIIADAKVGIISNSDKVNTNPSANKTTDLDVASITADAAVGINSNPDQGDTETAPGDTGMNPGDTGMNPGDTEMEPLSDNVKTTAKASALI